MDVDETLLDAALLGLGEALMGDDIEARDRFLTAARFLAALVVEDE